MKKIIIVNNNMKIGGVQKSLSNLLWAIEREYDITLVLLNKTGELLDDIPPSVKIVGGDGWFRFLGVSQGECEGNVRDYLLRGVLALHSRLFGRDRTLRWMLKRQPEIPGHFDCAVSFLHNGRRKAFYGGTQEYVLYCIDADKKIAFLHGDYNNCGANYKENNLLLEMFDFIAPCSDGCRNVLERAMPKIKDKIATVCNCHRFDEIRDMAESDPVEYDGVYVNVLMVTRLSHEKGIGRAMEALFGAVANGYPVKLHIVGGGPMKQKLMSLADTLGIQDNVVFYGGQKNPYRYMKNADLLLISSYHEAAPMVIDEAMCLGVPTLTVKTTSSRDMVEERGCGWVCENTDAALNEAFTAVVSDKNTLKRVKEKLMNLDMTNDMAKKQFAKIVSD